MPRALVIQHLEPEGPARIGDALARAGVETVIHRADLDPDVPTDPDGYDALVVMGGPMSADSDDGYPTRGRELALVAAGVRTGTPTLGVCLGAQLLAAAAGGRVVRGPGLEVGWGPIRLTDDAADDALFHDLPPTFPVLHWHGDTIEVPADAVLLASSEAYPNQAIRVGPAAWGLQFHLEIGRSSVESFVDAFPADAAAAPGGASAILDDTDEALGALDGIAALVLDRFAALVKR